MSGQNLFGVVAVLVLFLSIAGTVFSEVDVGERTITPDEYLKMVMDNDPGLKEFESYLQASKIRLSFTRKGEGYRTSLVLRSEKDLRENSIALRQNLPLGGNLDVYSRFSQSDLKEDYIGDASQNEVSYGVSLEIPFFAENLQKLSERTAEFDYEMALLQYEIAKRDLVTSAVYAFQDFILADEEIKIYRRAVELAKVLAEMSRKEFELGVSVDIGLLESEVQLASAKADLKRSLLKLENAKALLSRLMGLSEITDFSIRSALGDFISPPSDIEISKVIEDHPYMKLLEMNLDRLKLSAKELKSGFEFKAILSAEYDRTANGSDFPSGLGRFGGDPEFGLKVEIPIWDSHVTGEKVGEVMSRAEGLSYARERERRDLELKLEGEVRKWEFDIDIIDILSENEGNALKNLRFMESKFRAGLAGVEDVIRAQTNLTKASIEKVSAMVEQRKSGAELYQLTGIEDFIPGFEMR